MTVDANEPIEHSTTSHFLIAAPLSDTYGDT